MNIEVFIIKIYIMRNRLTERDLSRLIKRVINEGPGERHCDGTTLVLMRMMLKDNRELTLTYNKPSSGFVTVSTDSTKSTNFPCVCRKETLFYIWK